MAKRDPKDWLSLAVRPFKTLEREENQKMAAKDQAKQRDLFERTMLSGSYEPQYATQRAQSPQSRAYLESLLAGNNPDAIFSTSPNAAADKQIAGMSRDKMFGTQQDLIAQGQAIRNQPMPRVGVSMDTHRFGEENSGKVKTINNETLTGLYEAYLANPTPENKAAYEAAYTPAADAFNAKEDAAMPDMSGYQGVRGLGKGVERRTGERAQKRKRRREKRREARRD